MISLIFISYLILTSEITGDKNGHIEGIFEQKSMEGFIFILFSIIRYITLTSVDIKSYWKFK